MAEAFGKTALITGIMGQDGGLLAELLLRRGYRLIGVVKPGQNTQGAPHVAEVFSLDLTGEAAVETLLSEWKPDEIYHLAAFHHSSQDNSISSASSGREMMIKHNFLTSKTLALAVAKTVPQARLVFAASSQMYTPARPVRAVSEETARKPGTFYGLTKALSMDLLAFLRAENGLKASTAILFNHESPRRNQHFVTRKITLAAAAIKAGGSIRLRVQNIGAEVDWSSAHDVVQALALMGSAEHADDYVVASGRLHTVRELLDTAFKFVGLDWREHTDFQSDRGQPALVGRADRIRRTLGWQRKVSFEEMIVEMVQSDLDRLSS